MYSIIECIMNDYRCKSELNFLLVRIYLKDVTDKLQIILVDAAAFFEVIFCDDLSQSALPFSGGTS